MEFSNQTAFPAQAFEAIDQFGQEFRVFVARQTFSFASGELRVAEAQGPLCATDSGFDTSLAGSVRQESDYAPFKPRCDVIVNATAHPPRGRAVASFPVRLRMWTHTESAPLIDKALTVHGDRQICKRAWLARLAFWLFKWSTFTLLRPCPWYIRRAEACTAKPLRYELAYGGECRVAAGDRRARRISNKFRLTPEQATNHPAAAGEAPNAHVAFDPNPHGAGFSQSWYLRATRQKSVEAPAIERPNEMLSARQFWRWLTPSHLPECEASPFKAPAGLGIMPKTHPGRRVLVGTVDAAFIAGDAALPENFDFAIWNGAPSDQQIDYPPGGAEVELSNLCAAGSPGTRSDATGNVYLRLRLPADQCTLRLTCGDDSTYVTAMLLDTVMIEPETQTVSLTWRRTIATAEYEVVSAELRYQGTTEAMRERCAIDAIRLRYRRGVAHG